MRAFTFVWLVLMTLSACGQENPTGGETTPDGGADADDSNPFNVVPTCEESCEKGYACNHYLFDCAEEVCAQSCYCHPLLADCVAGDNITLPDRTSGMCINEKESITRCVNSCEENIANGNDNEEFKLCRQEHEWGCGELSSGAVSALCHCHGVCTGLEACQLLDRYGVAEGTAPELAINQCTEACQNWVRYEDAHPSIGGSRMFEVVGGNGNGIDYISCMFNRHTPTCDELSDTTCFGVVPE